MKCNVCVCGYLREQSLILHLMDGGACRQAAVRVLHGDCIEGHFLLTADCYIYSSLLLLPPLSSII